jgi:hypothetical protein
MHTALRGTMETTSSLPQEIPQRLKSVQLLIKYISPSCPSPKSLLLLVGVSTTDSRPVSLSLVLQYNPREGMGRLRRHHPALGPLLAAELVWELDGKFDATDGGGRRSSSTTGILGVCIIHVV